MDASLWILHNVLGAVDEDLEDISDIPSEIGAQTEIDRQTVVAVDDADFGNNISVHGSLDIQ